MKHGLQPYVRYELKLNLPHTIGVTTASGLVFLLSGSLLSGGGEFFDCVMLPAPSRAMKVSHMKVSHNGGVRGHTSEVERARGKDSSGT